MPGQEYDIESGAARGRARRFVIGGIVLLAILAAVVILAVEGGWFRPRISSERVRDAIVSSVEREAEASFFVTGTLDVSSTVTVENTKILFPDVLDFDLGTTAATVRLPGRVHYGFDVRVLTPEHIDVRDDGTVLVRIPALEVYAVEPDLSEMEVRTDVGWARLYRSSGRRVEQRAMEVASEALRRQAERHLADSVQPQINAARAMEKLVVPALKAAGVTELRIQFQITPELILQPAEVPEGQQ